MGHEQFIPLPTVERKPIQAIDREPLQDHCGIVMAIAPGDFDFFQTGLTALQELQTRGYDGVGFYSRDQNGTTQHYKGGGRINEVFPKGHKDSLGQHEAATWLFQTRYGTSGDFSQENVQPLTRTHQQTEETVTVVHNGQFSLENGFSEGVASDTVIFVDQLAASDGDDWNERITKTLSRKRGAWSLGIATEEALYLARDPGGFRPLWYGRFWDEQSQQYVLVAASETSALEAVEVTQFDEVLPGSILKLTASGIEEIQSPTEEVVHAFCIFEYVYLQGGRSQILSHRNGSEDIEQAATVDQIRMRSGRILAREAGFKDYEVDVIIGVPGTGIPSGKGFAEALGMRDKYQQSITDKDNPEDEQRTFMQADIDGIKQQVENHFNFDVTKLIGKRVVLSDDSLVRGNVTTGLVKILKEEYGVEEVHLRIVSPPIDKPCHLGINTRNAEELMAYGQLVSLLREKKLIDNLMPSKKEVMAVLEQQNIDQIIEEVTERVKVEVGADSLVYLSSAGLKEAVTGDPDAAGFCLGCMMGHQPPIDDRGVPVALAETLMEG